MNKSLKSILKHIDRSIFPEFYAYLDGLEAAIHRQLVGSCRSVLDVGCGVTLQSPLYKFAGDFDKVVGVDLFKPSIDENKLSGNYSEYHVMDVMEIDQHFKEKSFDAVIATDLIEHLEHSQGLQLLEKMEKIAIKKVIVFTPNGFIPQDEYDRNLYQIHKSGWTSKEFRGLGFMVEGVNGLKYLKGEMAKPKFRPDWFWQRISMLTQPITRILPSLAFQLLASKQLNG